MAIQHYSMSGSNHEGLFWWNDSGAKEYCGLTEQCGDITGRAQSLKLVEYDWEKKSLYPVVFFDYRLSCFGLSLEYDHNHIESGIRVVRAFATLIP